MKNILILLGIIILVGLNFRVYSDVKITNKIAKKYSLISIIVGIIIIIMYVLFYLW